MYSGAYEAFAGIRKVGLYYQPFAIAISLCVLIVRIFVQEKTSGMYFLNKTTVYRNILNKQKIYIVVVISIFTCIFWWLPEILYIFQNFYVSNPFAPVISMPAFQNFPAGMLSWQVIAITWLIRICNSIVTGLLVAFASHRANSSMMAWFGSVVLLMGQWGVCYFLQICMNNIVLFGK